MNRVVARFHRALIRWGLLGHPYGRAYVRRHYTRLGGYRRPADDE